MKKYVVFGAGDECKELLNKIPREEIYAVCDNDANKVGQVINGIEIISFEKLLQIKQSVTVIISIKFKFSVKTQLEINGIHDYVLYAGEYWKERSNASIFEDKTTDAEKQFNEILDAYPDKYSEETPIRDFYVFREIVSEYKGKLNGNWAMHRGLFYGESLIHGQWEVLMEYAGLCMDDLPMFPIICHGTFFEESHWEYPSAGVFSGIYDKEAHNQKMPYIPVFSVGGIIKYAKPIYSEVLISEEKKKLGNTVLIFAEHKNEGDPLDISYTELIKQIEEIWYRKFDTVMLCVYWQEIDNPIYEELERKGVKIVSAGLRSDRLFTRRLRTIFELADAVVVYENISSIAHALCLKKKCYFLPYKTSIQGNIRFADELIEENRKTKEWGNVRNIMYSRLGMEQSNFTESEKEIINKCFGCDIFLMPEEMNLIYEICKDIWKNCDYKMIDYPLGVYRTYWDYQKNYDFRKLTVLSNACGKGLINI